MDVKQYLRQAYWLDRRINANLRQLEELKSLKYKISACLMTDKVQTSGIPDKTAEILVKIIDLENQITADIDKLVDLKRDINETIEKMDNSEYRLLLTLRYLNNKYWEEIAVEMHYSYRGILYLHKDALIAYENVCTPLHITI